MRPTHLILFEGIPGAGKSSLAQALAGDLAGRGVAARWWYEEATGHPVYLFRDVAGISAVLADLAAGRHEQVIDAALAQWQQFASAVQHAPEHEIVILDGCLFGYLTWTLFHYAVPEEEIVAYLDRVAAILQPLAPCLVYCAQRDIPGTFARLGASRGAAMLARYVTRVEDSPYGQQHGLQGVDGLVAYWSAYQHLTDAAFARSDWATLAIDTSAGDWTTVHHAVLTLLDLAPMPPITYPPDDLARLCGVYQAASLADQPTCQVELVDDTLIIDGLPQTWPRTPLLPRPGGHFAVASLPYEVRFVTDAGGMTLALIVEGPALFGGSAAGTYRRIEAVV